MEDCTKKDVLTIEDLEDIKGGGNPFVWVSIIDSLWNAGSDFYRGVTDEIKNWKPRSR